MHRIEKQILYPILKRSCQKLLYKCTSVFDILHQIRKFKKEIIALDESSWACWVTWQSVLWFVRYKRSCFPQLKIRVKNVGSMFLHDKDLPSWVLTLGSTSTRSCEKLNRSLSPNQKERVSSLRYLLNEPTHSKVSISLSRTPHFRFVSLYRLFVLMFFTTFLLGVDFDELMWEI